MKKFLFALPILAMMLACTPEKDNPDNDNPGGGDQQGQD